MLSAFPLFCEKCRAYIGPGREVCSTPNCKWQRTAGKLPEPGKPIWSQQVPGAVTSRPCLINHQSELMIFWRAKSESGKYTGGVSWLNAHTGKMIAESQTFDLPPACDPVIRDRYAYMAFGERTPFGRGRLCCLDTSRHEKKWVTKKDLASLACAPLLYGDTLKVACADGYLYSFDSSDGAPTDEKPLLFGFEVGGAPGALLDVPVGPVVVESFSKSDEGRLWSINNAPVKLGSTIKAVALSEDRHSIYASLENGRILELDATSWPLKSREVACLEAQARTLISYRGRLYAGAGNKHMYELDPGSCEKRCLCTSDGEIWTPPVARGDQLYFGDTSGYIWSYNLTHPQNDIEKLYPVDNNVAASGISQITALAEFDGLIIAGTKNGQVVCLPDYLAIAESNQSGDYWSIAADFSSSPEKQMKYRGKAMELWEKDKDQRYKKPALLKALGRFSEAARAFENYADLIRFSSSKEAGDFYRQAVVLWDEQYWDSPTGDLYAEQQRDRVMQKFATCPEVQTPWLSAVCENAEQGFLQYSPGNFSVRVKNRGSYAAFHLKITITGPVEKVYEFESNSESPEEILRMMAPRIFREEERRFSFEIVPTYQKPLRVALEYKNWEDRVIRTTIIVPIHLEKALIVPARDIVTLKLTGIENLVVRGEYIGSVCSNPVGKTNNTCGCCGGLIGPDQKYCDECGQSL